MTEVTRKAALLLLPLGMIFGQAAAQTAAKPISVTELYDQLRTVGLDPSRVYQLREASLERPGIHLSLSYGTIGFTQDVLGRVTGAFFEGEGEVLIVPPDRAERASLALFTNAAILEEKFSTAYFRFNDDTASELQPFLRPAEDASGFVAKWSTAAHNMAESDAIRLVTTFCNLLLDGNSAKGQSSDDQMLHARLQGVNLGIFDVFYDTRTTERVSVAKLAMSEGLAYYDVWTSFNPRPYSTRPELLTPQDEFRPLKFKIQATVEPPQHLQAETVMEGEVLRGGGHTLVFELSRYLPVTKVESENHTLEFIHNPALEGSQLARRGNDLVVVVFPRVLETGEMIRLRFEYGGEVLSEQGKGLLYVGARGTWYPNLGLRMAQFDLTFRYPEGWTLLATGKRIPDPGHGAGSSLRENEQESHWVSERPIPIAGFNLGQYEKFTAQAGDVQIETYATGEVEHGFPERIREGDSPQVSPEKDIPVLPLRPSPVRNAQAVADRTADAVKFFSDKIMGPFPYSSLAMTQLPGPLSQGWPGLVFLSSYAFLSPAEAARLGLDPIDTIMQSQTAAHETAHQWWGDLICWRSYRDQWISEGLANYLSLMQLESRDPDAFREVMDRYRRALLQKDKNGVPLSQAGPVTLGIRLSSSRFPGGYEAISYGRGTWLFHMLRYTMRDASRGAPGQSAAPQEEPFVLALKKVREKFEGMPVSTRELLDTFAAELPRSLWYENKKSLDWFFKSWIQGTAVPEISIRNLKITHRQGGTVVSGVLVQKDSPADLVTSVPIYVVRSGRKQQFLGRAFADGEENSFRLTAPADTQQVLIDPERTVLRSNP